MSISLFIFCCQQAGIFAKKMNAQRVHIGNQHSFFFTFCQFFFCLIRLLFLFKLHFAFHSPRNVLFLDTFSHVCLCVYMFVWRNFALSTLADFCAAFSLRTSLFFLLYTIRFVSRISYSSWFVVSLFVVLEILAFFFSALWLCLGEIKKNFIYFAFTDFFILFFFLLDLFHFFANFFFFHSLAHSLSPSSYSVNLISCSFCAICHTRKCSMFTYKYSYKLLLYYYISRTHQKCE